MHNRTSEPPARSPRRRSVALAVAALTAVALAALTPWPRGFQGAPTGDAELMAEVEQALGGKHWQHIAAARVDGDEVAFAGTGADEHTEFEIGSITKTFTAALFADAIDRGEIDADTRLGEVWPDLEGKVAEVSLESIAMQRSGLPAQKPWSGFAEGLTSILANYVRADPYRASPSDVVAGLDSVELGDREPEYSNFGFAVLGQALAEVTGHDYAELVRTRITEPLGMDDTFVPGSPEGLSHGFTASGLPAAPWVMGGHAPAGAIRSSTHDMAIWLEAVRDGTAPGAEAAEPRTDFDDSDRIGWAWFTTKDRSPNLTWHNGGTGGYRSFLGFSAETGHGVIVVSDSANDVDAAASLISDPAEAESAEAESAEAGTAEAEAGSAESTNSPKHRGQS
jgi:CubicO group peptidase (beta-lactamase class C family)